MVAAFGPSLSPTTMPLVSLPLDILLAILRDLDIVDVVHTGMVSPLKVAVLARTETERHRLAKTSVGPYKTVTSGWINSKSCVENTRCSDLPRLRWNKGDNENGFVAKGLLGISGVRKLLLLPGGKTVLVISDYGSVSLCQIELKDGRASLPIVANFKYDQRVIFGPKWNKLLIATSPCPILVRRQGDE